MRVIDAVRGACATHAGKLLANLNKCSAAIIGPKRNALVRELIRNGLLAPAD